MNGKIVPTFCVMCCHFSKKIYGIVRNFCDSNEQKLQYFFAKNIFAFSVFILHVCNFAVFLYRNLSGVSQRKECKW